MGGLCVPGHVDGKTRNMAGSNTARRRADLPVFLLSGGGGRSCVPFRIPSLPLKKCWKNAAQEFWAAYMTPAEN